MPGLQGRIYGTCHRREPKGEAPHVLLETIYFGLDEKRDERRDSPRRSLFTDNRANNASAGNDHNREGGDGIAPLCTGTSFPSFLLLIFQASVWL